MITLNLINDGKDTIPVLVESTSADIYFTSSIEVSVLVGNQPDKMSLLKTFKKNESFSPAFGDSLNSESIHVTDLAIGSYIKLHSDTPLTSATLRWKGSEALLITPMEVGMLARPCYADEQKVMRYISEAEQNNIKNTLGDDLFLRLKAGEEKLLLNGGTYERDGKRYYLNGVKKALAYYTYSRLVESSSVELTRQGVVNRRSEYSDMADNRDILSVSRETYAIADRYMEECLSYIKGTCSNKDVNSSRTKIKIIGR